MKALLLTLGHNSSAILVEDNQVKWGYETERWTQKKSDSTFPQAVLEGMKVKANDIDIVYATHWAPDGKLSSMSAKHWDPSVFDGRPVRSLNPFNVTHHDTHMAAAMLYAGKDFPRKGSIGVVVDGFGTMGEHFSIYDLGVATEPVLLKRYHGYDTSLGLWYQYATAFMGMKMHEDEYKLLGYEVHVTEDQARSLDISAAVTGNDWLDRMHKSVYGSAYDPAYNVDALPAVKNLIFSHLTKFCVDNGINDPSSYEGRSLIAYYVQAVLEHVVLGVISEYDPTNVLCSGGVFYNVKLNKTIIDNTDGLVCVYPLAGDQGNALGLYAMDNPEFEFPADLNWGVRELKQPGHVPNMFFCKEENAYQVISVILKKVGFVNVVRGGMEFGPRAMCNTSTLVVPKLENVHRINTANGRNTVMPMAPVMTREQYENLFLGTDRVWKSEQHMIVAMQYKEQPPQHLLGCAHQYSQPYPHFTGRPQVIDKSDALMTRLLEDFGHPLINTSFNYHGKPIAFRVKDVIDNHMMQHANDFRFHTVVIKNA